MRLEVGNIWNPENLIQGTTAHVEQPEDSSQVSNQSESAGQTGRARSTTTITPTTSTSSTSRCVRASESVSTDKPHRRDLGPEAGRSDDHVEHQPDGGLSCRDTVGSSKRHRALQKLRTFLTRSRDGRESKQRETMRSVKRISRKDAQVALIDCLHI